MSLHVGALGDTGAGKEPIFILYLKRLNKKKKNTREERFNLNLKTIPTFSDLCTQVLYLTAELMGITFPGTVWRG